MMAKGVWPLDELGPAVVAEGRATPRLRRRSGRVSLAKAVEGVGAAETEDMVGRIYDRPAGSVGKPASAANPSR